MRTMSAVLSDLHRKFLSRPPWSLNLRRKLIIAFLGAAALAALCGVVGLYYVSRIAGNVAVFSDVTSPLLVESMSLVDNARKIRSVVFRATLGDQPNIALGQQIANIS